MPDGVKSCSVWTEPWTASETARHSLYLRPTSVNCKVQSVTSLASSYIGRGEGTRLRREVKKLNVTSHQSCNKVSALNLVFLLQTLYFPVFFHFFVFFLKLELQLWIYHPAETRQYPSCPPIPAPTCQYLPFKRCPHARCLPPPHAFHTPFHTPARCRIRSKAGHQNASFILGIQDGSATLTPPYESLGSRTALTIKPRLHFLPPKPRKSTIFPAR
jgi:hypothetical protein